jgi:hypothetical protein
VLLQQGLGRPQLDGRLLLLRLLTVVVVKVAAV